MQEPQTGRSLNIHSPIAERASGTRILGLRRWPLPEALLVGVVMLVTFLHGLPNLAFNPPISFDEGYILQAPHNLLLEGLYGTRTATDALPFDQYLSTGPTVLVPIWASFKVLGEGLAQARLVALIYSALCVAVFYALVRLYATRGVAFIAALLLSLSLYPYNRVALGEVPGLFWLFLGGWLWLRAIQRPTRLFPLATAGLVLGLAVVTKHALAPIAATTLIGSWMLTRPSQHRLATSALLLPLLTLPVPALAWYFFQQLLLGWDDVLARLFSLSEYQSQFLELSYERLQQNLATLSSNLPGGLAPWIAPALLLLALQLLKGSLAAPKRNFLPVLAVVCTAYYLLSVGWPRYGFWAVAVTTALIAALVPLFLQEVSASSLVASNRFVSHGTPALMGLILLAYPAFWTWNSLWSGDTEAPRTASFLLDQTNAEEVLGTTEWEMDFLTARRFKHPPTYVATTAMEVVEKSFDWSWPGVDWVVIGPIGRYLRADLRLAADPRFVERFSAGPYRVFQRNSGPAPGWTWSTIGATATPPLTAEAPVGQTFTAPYDMLNKVRILLAGDGQQNNATVRLTLYDSTDTQRVLARTEVPGNDIVENKWYAFDLGRLRVIKGRTYYLELIAEPGLGQRSPTAWYNDSVDHYTGGSWYLGHGLRAGDLYFGVLGLNARDRRPREFATAPGF